MVTDAAKLRVSRLLGAQVQNLTYPFAVDAILLVLIMSDLLKTFEGHSAYVRCLSLLDDGTFLSGSYDHTLKLWEVSAAGPTHLSASAVLGLR